jgi:hypothetical protein
LATKPSLSKSCTVPATTSIHVTIGPVGRGGIGDGGGAGAGAGGGGGGKAGGGASGEEP